MSGERLAEHFAAWSSTATLVELRIIARQLGNELVARGEPGASGCFRTAELLDDSITRQLALRASSRPIASADCTPSRPE